MPYEYLEDVAIADAAIHAWGESVEEVFVAAAEATLGLMVDDIDLIEPTLEREIAEEDDQLDLLLVSFLQTLLFYKDAEGLLLRPSAVRIRPAGAGYRLEARCRGEHIDPARHRLATDVKAVTTHRLRVAPTGQGWEAEVVVDI